MDKDCFNGAAGIPPEFQTTTAAAMAVQWNGPNCPSEMGFLNSSLDQYSHFDSSSFTSTNDGFFLRHLIGKLGGASLPPPTTAAHVMDDTNLKIQFPIADQINHNLGNPGTLAPATAPPLPSISADPGFIERAAKFSCFGSRSFNGRTSSIGHGSKSTNPLPTPTPTPPLLSGSKLPRVSSSPALKPDQTLIESKPTGLSDRKSGKMTGSGSNSNDESSVSEQIPTSEMSKKRKAISRPKSKEEGSPNPTKQADNEDDNGSNPKRSKSNNTETDKKPPEPPKDYIHVRARRGQATDSHSLAERVRREKISERMKLLQDLVPGCNKVTGKALMLDEIINYVQSLQRQVEFLSMKLASVNPALDFNMETLLSKDVNVNINMLQQSSQQMYTGAQEVQLYQHNVQHDSSSSSISISRGPLMDHPLHFDAPTENFPEFPGFNEDDLNSIVQMGFANFPVPNMKIER